MEINPLKKFILLIAMVIIGFSTASALEPVKVAIVNNSGTPVSVEIRLNNYTGGTANLVYTQAATSYTPNGSGIIIANISGAGWTAIAAASVTSYHILDVYVGGTLAAQYRLDNLLLSQSQGGILDIQGNLTPGESGTANVGSDENRWGEVYVEESTMHIGPADGELNNTELALSYNTTTNTAHIQVDATDAILATSSGVTIPGTLTVNGATTLGNLAGVGTRNISVNAAGQVVVAESSVITDATISGNGTTATPLGLADNAVTSAKIVDATIVASDLASNSITTAKITDKNVTPSKIANGTTTGQVLTFDGTDAVWAVPSGSTVSTNSTINGDGSGGSPLGINLGNSNTWTANQTFAGTFLITANSRIAMTNSDNNARDIRYQEPSGTGSQYIGWRAPSVTNNGNYVFPAVVGSSGQVLALNTSNGIDSATTHWITPSTSPTGAAGGNLTGTYPNPTIANDAITTAMILDGQVQNADLSANSVTTSKVANGTVTTSKMADSAISGLKLLTFAVTNRHLADGSVTASKIDPTGAASGNVISYDGTNVVWTSPSSGTVSTNATLTGNGSSGSPLGVNLGNSNTWTANQTFGATFLITANSRIAMTNSDNNARDIRYQEPSGTGSQYIGWRAPSVTNNGNYVFPAVVGTSGQVLALNYSNGIDSATTHWITPSGGSPSGAAGGDLAGTYPNPTIANSSISSSNIIDSTITSADISPIAAIPYSKLVLTSSIQNSDILANAITTSKVANGTVTTSKMADSAISGLKLLTFAVTNRHLANGSVSTSKIDPTGASTNNVLTYNGSSVVWALPGSTLSYIEHNYSGGNTAKVDLANDARVINLVNANADVTNETLGTLANGSVVTIRNNSGFDFTFTDATSGALNNGNIKTWYRIGGIWTISN